jgi:hypothetical protein
MTSKFESAFWKINRARQHADDLEAKVRDFWAADPYEVEVVGSPLTGPGSYRVKRVATLPESVPLIAGDAAHNIRSALDHFAWEAAPAQDRGSWTAFPIWNSTEVCTEAKWHKQVERQMKGAAPGLIAAVKRLEAWEHGRDSLLWAINELERVDKHRLLLSVGVALTRILLDGDSYEISVVKKFSGGDPGSPLIFEPIKWAPLKEGSVLFGSPHEFGGATSASFTFDVCLGEPEMLVRESAVDQLRILAGLAEKLIRELASLV